MNKPIKYNKDTSQIHFTKYESYGNSFIIIDEVSEPILSESEKKSFAWFATNTAYGIGADNLLIVGNWNLKTQQEYKKLNVQSNNIPTLDEADYIFRMFEPDGVEAHCCGNGLLCIAHFLAEKYGIFKSRILTELPATPVAVSIGSIDFVKAWIELEPPRQLDKEFVCSGLLESSKHPVQKSKIIIIQFPKGKHISDMKSFALQVYVVNTGEPHVVVPVELLPKTLSKLMFKNKKKGAKILNAIGISLNKTNPDIFPKGVSVNVCRKINDGIEIRTWERGLFYETEACGTGAFAAVIAYGFKKPVHVLPWVCRHIYPHAAFYFEPVIDTDKWRMIGEPRVIANGNIPIRNNFLPPNLKMIGETT